MQRRLTQMGMRPISLAVDVTNYVMLALGQPLHAFDADSCAGRSSSGAPDQASGSPPSTTSTGHWTPGTSLITDAGELPLAIAGVMGGATSEVTTTTTTVLIEAAHFDPATIARSSRRHKLITEASKRLSAASTPSSRPLPPTSPSGSSSPMAAGRRRRRDRRRDRRGLEPTPRASYDRLALDEPGRIVGVAPTRATRSCGPSPTLAARSRVTRPRGPRGATPRSSPSPRPRGGRTCRRAGLRRGRPDRRLRHNPLGPAHPDRCRHRADPRPAGPSPARGHPRRPGYVEVLTYPFTGLNSADDLEHLATDDERRHALRLANPLSDEAPSCGPRSWRPRRRATAQCLPQPARRPHGLGLVTLPGGGSAARRCPRWPHVPAMPRLPGSSRPSRPSLGTWPCSPPVRSRRADGGARTTGRVVRPRQSALAAGRALGLDLEVGPADLAPWHPGRCARLALADGTTVGYAGELHPPSSSASACLPGAAPPSSTSTS